MAGKRRARRVGVGMAPLFDLDPLVVVRSAAPVRQSQPGNVQRDVAQAADAPPRPVEYWVRGMFRCGDRQYARTVQAVGMNTSLDADVARFVRYLTEEGFQFSEGRAYLVEVLGVGADDGVQIFLSGGVASS